VKNVKVSNFFCKKINENELHLLHSMKTRIDLTQMKDGEKGRVVEIVGGKGMLSKLDAMGIRVGVEIVKVSKQPLRGPIIVEVCGSMVAVGYGMARRIIVEKV